MANLKVFADKQTHRQTDIWMGQTYNYAHDPSMQGIKRTKKSDFNATTPPPRCLITDFLIDNKTFKGSYFDFSHITELENIYITEIYMRKQYKSSISKNHKIKQKCFF